MSEVRWGVLDHRGFWAQYRATEEGARDTFNDHDACALVQHVGRGEEYTIVAEKPCCKEHKQKWVNISDAIKKKL